jgi:hypothetical protein
MGDQVFISYSRKDRDFVRKLSSILRENNIGAWIDVEKIEPGTNWRMEIERSIKSASTYIFVSSRNSVGSDWMFMELDAATNQSEKIIIPVILDDVGEKSLPTFLKKYQWIDFRHDFDGALERLLATLRKTRSLADEVMQEAPQEEISKGYVFLNYAEDDFDFVESLKRFFKDKGYAYWDYRESDRDFHSQLFLELENVISEASATLSVLSESWKRSKWTVKEFFFSDEVGTPIFLLMAKNMGPTLATAGMTYIDFVRDYDGGLLRLDRELKRKGL